MKIIEKGLTEQEFEDYCEDVKTRMESETCYYGQQDEYVPHYGDIQRRHIYGDEKEEHEVVLYEQHWDGDKNEATYDIYDTID